MEQEQITNEEEYNRALQRIDELMSSQKGTPEFEELEKLTDLVEDYEDKLCE